jgi:hypothetical protein
MAYWCDDRRLFVEQCRLDAQQQRAKERRALIDKLRGTPNADTRRKDDGNRLSRHGERRD